MTPISFYLIVILIAFLIVWRRIRSTYRPIKGKGGRILFPILFFIPGIASLLNLDLHLTLLSVVGAILFGIVLSAPLVWTTQYEIREDGFIYTKKSIAFFISFLVVLSLRFILREFLNNMDSASLTALFMLVAISYIVPWRIISFIKFRKLYKSTYVINTNC
ncbi:CcdC protein domain-containing protein [Peribacillus simplex]|uniref:CcdC protein domain-containing protein n=1 Tax=Peribacillus simplex TaxID=1478 RepID=UPI003D26AB9E